MNIRIPKSQRKLNEHFISEGLKQVEKVLDSLRKGQPKFVLSIGRRKKEIQKCL